jgi:hypothetical protein
MMEVEKESIRKSEAERDIGNERQRGKISDILSLTDLYFKGNQYTLKKYVARDYCNLKYIVFSSKNAYRLNLLQT